MFSSNHIPCSTKSTNTFSPESLFEHENSNLHFNYHQPTDNPFISSHFATQQQFSEGSWLQYYDQEHEQEQDQDQDQEQDQDDELLDSVVKKKMSTSMKDVGAKIFTDQGTRDRRVRLSIDISRKFFCLQDLLGFDKPSKTLDWLFAKSLPAIKDLVEQTNQCSSSSMVTDQSNVKFLESVMRLSAEEDGPKKKKITQRCKVGCEDNYHVSRSQSRVEARSRARERTKEKLRVKKFDDDQETWKMSKDSSFLIGGFMEDLAVNDLDLEE